MSILVENCKNPLLVDFSNIVMKRSNIIKKFAKSIIPGDTSWSDYSINENDPNQILNGFKKTKLIKWIEDSGNYTLSNAEIFRVENGVGVVTASGYTAKLYFKKLR